MGKIYLNLYVLFDELSGREKKDYTREVLPDILLQLSKKLPTYNMVEISCTLIRMQLIAKPEAPEKLIADMRAALSRVIIDCEQKQKQHPSKDGPALITSYILVMLTNINTVLSTIDLWEMEWSRLENDFFAEIEYFTPIDRTKRNPEQINKRLLPKGSAYKDLQLDQLGTIIISGGGVRYRIEKKIDELKKILLLKKDGDSNNEINIVQNENDTMKKSITNNANPSEASSINPPSEIKPFDMADSSANQPDNNKENNLDAVQTKTVKPAEWQIKEPPPDLAHRTSHTHTDFRDVYEWYMCGASRRGKLHENEGTFREDAFQIEQAAGWLLIAVADGAGSHHLSRVGSNLAVKTSIELMKENLEKLPPNEENLLKALQETVQKAQLSLVDRAKELETEFRDLSTTLLLVMYYPKKNLIGVAQVGDGLIAVQLRSGSIELLGQSESGEYSGQTYFLTSHKPDELITKCELRELKDIKYIFVMTDGISDDFYPPKERLPGLIKAIPPVISSKNPPDELLALINYDRIGSFDDRTLIVACKKNEIDAEENKNSN